jgi:hypothetical protein
MFFAGDKMNYFKNGKRGAGQVLTVGENLISMVL